MANYSSLLAYLRSRSPGLVSGSALTVLGPNGSSPILRPRLRMLGPLAVSGNPTWYLGDTGTIASSACKGAWLAKGAASFADSETDLSGNSKTLSVNTGSSSWDATRGWKFDGTWAMTTGVILPTGTTKASTIACSWGGYTGSSGCLMGYLSGLCECLFIGNNSSSTVYDYGWASDAGSSIGHGAHPGGRGIDAGGNFYFNGTSNATNSGSCNNNGVAAFIGSANDGSGGFRTKVTADIYAVSMYNITLSATQAADLDTALSKL